VSLPIPIGEVQAVRSKLIVVALEVGATRYEIFQIFFGKDRSLYVNFPYFKQCTGILAAATITGDGQTTSQVDLQIGGKIASHYVKYSHHPDGCAQFSQTRKVWTKIKRQSVALDSQAGHIFSLAIQGLQGFKAAHGAKDHGSTPKRATVTFQLQESADMKAIKWVGRWFNLADLKFFRQIDVATLRLGGQIESVVGPNIDLKDPLGQQQRGILVASPYDNARHVLVISCEVIPRLGPEPEMMLFYGGFDAREIMDDTLKEAGFLVFIYPVSGAEELKKIIGTIDI